MRRRCIILVSFESAAFFIKQQIIANIQHLKEITRNYNLVCEEEIEMILDFSVAQALSELLHVPVISCSGNLDVWDIFYKSHLRVTTIESLRNIVRDYALHSLIEVTKTNNEPYVIKILTTDSELVISYHHR